MSAGTVTTSYTPIHRLRLIASFALLGAVLAGSTAFVVPAVDMLVPAALDLHAIGAVLGGVAGTVVQWFHN